MADPRIPRAVGYWGTGDPPSRFPRPQWLVRPGWRAEERDRIAAYLRAGKMVNGWCGLARCRFEGCGILLGCCDMTDGRWVWPQKMEHYLLEHAVSLPDEFIDDMRAAGWQVPAELDAEDLKRRLWTAGQPLMDSTFWREWSERMRIE